MAFEFMLRVQTDTPPEGVLAELRKVPSFSSDQHAFAGLGIAVRVREETDAGKELVAEAYQITPTTELIFRLDKTRIDDATIKFVAGVSILVLLNLSADGVLMFNGEDVLFVRRKSRLVLNRQSGFWTREIISVVPQPFAWESIDPL